MNNISEHLETAILAGGCFWGMEELIRALPGVIDTQVGYTGGHMPGPSYKDICTGTTGHAEAVQIKFDPAVLSYRDLLVFFFQIHDPTTPGRQGNDCGPQYRSAIFCVNEEQQAIARALIREIENSGKWPGPITTEIKPAGPFYEATSEHQDYLQNHPGGYSCHWQRPDWTIE